MTSNKIDAKQIAEHWNRLSAEKFTTAEGLLTLGRRSDALFFCNLALECALKAIVTLHSNDYPPYTHDLGKLVRLADLTLPAEFAEELKEIDTFNIRARYDDYKFEFYKKATEEYTKRYFTSTKELLLWLSHAQ